MNKRLRRFCLFWVLACMAPWPIIFLGISFSNDLGISGSIYSVGSTDVTLYHVALIFTGARSGHWFLSMAGFTQLVGKSLLLVYRDSSWHGDWYWDLSDYP